MTINNVSSLRHKPNFQSPVESHALKDQSPAWAGSLALRMNKWQNCSVSSYQYVIKQSAIRTNKLPHRMTFAIPTQTTRRVKFSHSKKR